MNQEIVLPGVFFSKQFICFIDMLSLPFSSRKRQLYITRSLSFSGKITILYLSTLICIFVLFLEKEFSMASLRTLFAHSSKDYLDEEPVIILSIALNWKAVGKIS
jgi:hypothetical protein